MWCSTALHSTDIRPPAPECLKQHPSGYQGTVEPSKLAGPPRNEVRGIPSGSTSDTGEDARLDSLEGKISRQELQFTAGHGVVLLGPTLTAFSRRAQLGVQAACRSDSSRLSHSPIWFQLAKIRAHELDQSCRNMTIALRPHNASGSDVSIGTSGPRPGHSTS